MMAELSEIVYVCGHRKPDADSACSAHVAASLLSRIYPARQWKPILAGTPGPQVEWIFEQAGLALPEVLDDIRPRAIQCAREPHCVTPETPLGEAMDQILTHGISLLPVVDDSGLLVGLLSTRRPEAQFLFHMNVEDFVGSLIHAEDLLRGLPLEPMNRAAKESCPPEATGIAPFTALASAPTDHPGRWLICAAEDMADALDSSPCALIVCGLIPESGARLVEKYGVPCWHFKGSLMALIASLPRALPVGRIMSKPEPVALEDDFLDEVVPVLAQLPHAIPVVDQSNKLKGVLSHRSALRPPRVGLVLVDHFERSQMVGGTESAEVLGIIDHHRVGTLETPLPVRVDCRPLGSTASIIACRFREAALEPDRAEALLLLGALVSDTLLLTSPTTTEIDRELAPLLASRAEVDLESFGRQVLEKNDRLGFADADELIHSDMKAFHSGETSFVIGQVETTNLELLPSRKDELAAQLEVARQKARADFAVLMVTDVFAKKSHLLVADDNVRRIEKLLQTSPAHDGVTLDGMVSRKKQALPMILERLGEIK